MELQQHTALPFYRCWTLFIKLLCNFSFFGIFNPTCMTNVCLAITSQMVAAAPRVAGLTLQIDVEYCS